MWRWVDEGAASRRQRTTLGADRNRLFEDAGDTVFPYVHAQLDVCSESVQGPQPVAQFHRANMQRSNPYEKVLNVINVGTLAGLWSYNAGSYMQSSTAVANGVVYVGTEHGDVYAFGLK